MRACVCLRVWVCVYVCVFARCLPFCGIHTASICLSSKGNTALLPFSWNASTHQCCWLEVCKSSWSFIITTDLWATGAYCHAPIRDKDSRCNLNFSQAVCLYLSSPVYSKPVFTVSANNGNYSKAPYMDAAYIQTENGCNIACRIIRYNYLLCLFSKY